MGGSVFKKEKLEGGRKKERFLSLHPTEMIRERERERERERDRDAIRIRKRLRPL